MKKFNFCRAGKKSIKNAFDVSRASTKNKTRLKTLALCFTLALITLFYPASAFGLGANNANLSNGNFGASGTGGANLSNGNASDYIKKAEASSEQYYTEGQFTNVAVLVSFKGEEQFESDFYKTLENTYNASDVSVKSFFKAQTNGKVNMRTLIAGGGKVYKVTSPRERYMPRYGKWLAGENEYEVINELGYDNRYYNENGEPVASSVENAVPCGERLLLEQRLLREVIELARYDITAELYSSYGSMVQSLTLITDVNGAKSEYGELLWSHKSIALNSTSFFGDGSANGGYYAGYYFPEKLKNEYSDLDNVYIALSKISAYNVICSAELTARKVNYQNETVYDVGLLSHELMHSLGVGDYYSLVKTTDDYDSVGEFDVMASHCAIPQYSLSYVREKAGWLTYENFNYVNKNGTYTLYPVGSGTSGSGAGSGAGSGSSGKKTTACKIILTGYFNRGEYFMAEVRSNENKIGEGVFDSGLSNSGLIIYRVNEKAAFTNANGEIGTRDYGNAYGEEVYVFRKGAQALNSPLGTFSFAMLGEKAAESGTRAADVINDYTRFGVKASHSGDEREYISYSDGTNSGIAFENITKNADGSVTFTVSLPESDGALPVLNDTSVKIMNYFNGDVRLMWNMAAKSGTFYVLAVRATNRLKSIAERGDEAIPAESIKNGAYAGYKTLYYATAPLAEKKLTLPDFYDDALIFIAAETENGTVCSSYVCAIERENLSIKQYFLKSLDPLYVALFGEGLLIVTAVVIILIIKNRPKKVYEKPNSPRGKTK